MKTILLLLLTSLSLNAVEFREKSTITITNATANGDTFVFNGDTRTATNALTSTTFATGATIGETTTNLYRQIIRYKFVGIDYVELVSSNELILHGKPNVLFTNTITGDWASVVIASNNIGEKTVNISVPAENWPDQEDATNAFSQFALSFTTHNTNSFGGVFTGTLTNVIAKDITFDSADNPRMFFKEAGGGAIVASFSVDEFGTPVIWDGTNNLVSYVLPHRTAGAILTFDIADDYYGQLTNNNTWSGVNIFSRIANPTSPRTNNTSLANGNNAAVDIADRGYVKLSGPSAAFTINGIAGGLDGRKVYLQNSTGYQITIAHDSGTDPTAANRIYVLNGSDLVGTNGVYEFIYDSEVSRWIYVGK